MVTNHILLFGGNGQIGKALQRLVLPADWHMSVLTRKDCDLMQPGAIASAIQKAAPDLVINAAAMTDVDACETDAETAQEVNFHAVANIAAQCDTLSAPLIHLSTDYVFDGKEQSTPYTPDDPMNPLGVYGQTKMLGEEAARHGLHWHVVMRISLVFSDIGNNPMTRVLQRIEAGENLRGVTDQTACPTSARAVAEALVTIGSAILKGKGDGFGTFHVCGDPPATRFEFMQAIVDAAAPYCASVPTLSPILSADLALRAQRPAYSALNPEKTLAVYGIRPRPWREDLLDYVHAYFKGRGP